MAIINTLITATDKTKQGLDSASKNFKRWGKDVKDAANDAEDSIDGFEGAYENLKNLRFDSLSGFVDSFKQAKTSIAAAEGAMAQMAVRAGLLAGGIGVVAVGLFNLVSASSDYVREMRQVAESTGTNIETLQRLKAAFYDTGLEIDKFGDINKDTLDHLGDAFRDGSGPAADMKAYGLNLKEFNQYLNQTDGGIKAVVHSFYQMKQAGRSTAEITNMMETLASDSSHMITTLNKFATESDALNYIHQQSAGITDELAQKYAEFDKKVAQLQTQFQTFKANALSPTVDELNTLLSILNGDWEGTNFTQWAKNFMFGGNGLIPDSLRNIFNVKEVDVDSAGRNNLINRVNAFQGDVTNATKETPSGGWVDKGKEEAAAAAAAKAAAAKAAQFKKSQEQAAKWLQQLDLNNASEQEKAELNYQIQLKQLDGFLEKKLINQQQYNHGVEALNTALYDKTIKNIYQRDLDNLNNKKERMLISETDYQNKLLDIQIRYNKEKLDSAYYAEMQALENRHKLGLEKEDEYQQKLQGIKDKYSYDTKKLSDTLSDKKQRLQYEQDAESLKKFTDNMNQGISIASQFTEAIANSQEEGTAAWYAATIATKAMAVAQAIMYANLTAAQVAASTPGPGAIAAGETARAWGYANAAMIAATGIIDIAGKREAGGKVNGGGTYLVGENGPELLSVGANQTGQITSNKNLKNALAGGSGGDGAAVVVHQNNTFQAGAEVGAETLTAMKTLAETTFDRKIRDALRPQGILSNK